MLPQEQVPIPEVIFQNLKADPAELCINIGSTECHQTPTMEAALKHQGCLYLAACCGHPECQKAAEEALVGTFLNHHKPRKIIPE